MIELQSVDFSYTKRDKLVLDSISFQISKGEIVAVIGRNGAGKTTLLKHLNGLLKPSNGAVIIDGENIKKERISKLAQVVGLAFQNPNHQLFAETVEKELAFGPKNLGVDKEERLILAHKIAKQFGITHLLDRNPLDLSGGERRLVSIASVLTMNQKILALDEPSFGQDYKQKLKLGNFLNELSKSGITIIFVSHDIEFVYNFADRVIVMKNGQIIADDTKQVIFKNRELLEQADLLVPIYLQLLDELQEKITNFPSTSLDKKLDEIVQKICAGQISRENL
jgi:energy-coupling factor transport system ATP-binding protein